MAEWVMFDVAFSDVGGLNNANCFQFKHLILIFGEGYRLKMAT